jgi:small-conductance mechanosensitive channel
MKSVNLEIEPYLPDALARAWIFLQEYPVLIVILFSAIGYVVGKLLQKMIRSVLEHAAERSRARSDSKMIRHLTAPVVQTSVVIALVAAEKAFDFSESVDRFLVRVLFTLLLILWGRAWFKATTVAMAVFSEHEHRFKLLQPRTRPLVEMGTKVFILSLLLWLFMIIWDIDGTAWLASAGVVGIAVGLAAKDTLANFISGLSIIADAPYKIGDYIILDTGERGVVTKLGMRSTRLLTRDDVEISIPNAVMGNAKITNESGGPGIEYRIRLPVSVAYGTDPEKVIRTLEQVAQDNELILDQPAPRVRMRAFGESSKNFELLGWISHSEQRGRALHELLVEVDKRFQREGITIPFPQRDVHIKAAGAAPATPV